MATGTDDRTPGLRLSGLLVAPPEPGWVPDESWFPSAPDVPEPAGPDGERRPGPLSPETASEVARDVVVPAGDCRPEPWQPAASSVVEPATAAVQVGRTPAPPALSMLLGGWLADRLPPWASRVGPRRLLAGALLAGCLVVGVAIVAHGRSTSVGTSPVHDSYLTSDSAGAGGAAATAGSDGTAAGGATSAGGPATTGSASSDGSSIVVDVSGRVRHPGLVTLPMGSRVADAVAAAGGALHAADVATVDLAAKVGDGQLVVIGPGATAATAAGTTAGATPGTAGPVDLDSADLTTLETLPGVGPATAQKIIDWRTANGGFASVSQLQQVPGIGPTRYAELSPLVVS